MNVMLDVNNWLQGHVTQRAGTQNLIRSRAMGYPGYYGLQIGQETNHISLFIDPLSVAGGAFSGNVNELLLPNKVIFQQANAVTSPTDWLNGQSITLDNGKVGIGINTPSYKLDVESISDSVAGAYIQAGKSSQGEIQNTGLIIGSRTDTATGDYIGVSFSGNASVPARGRAAIGAVSINGASGMDLVFMTRNAGDGSQLGSSDEKMRINSSGNVAISGNGIQIDRPDVAGGKPYVFFKSGGTTQASIYGALGSSKGLRFFLEGGIADFDNNIKASGVYLGGSGSANLLDDYEEGTWTPVISHNDGTGAIPIVIDSARYVKVGDLVYISAWLSAINTGGGGHANTGAYYGIRGMPFTPENYGVWELAYASSGVTAYGGYSSSASLYFMHNGTNGQRSANHVNGAGVNAWGASQHFMFNCTYRVQ